MVHIAKALSVCFPPWLFHNIEEMKDFPLQQTSPLQYHCMYQDDGCILQLGCPQRVTIQNLTAVEMITFVVTVVSICEQLIHFSKQQREDVKSSGMLHRVVW
jgi:hypothetical protein